MSVQFEGMDDAAIAQYVLSLDMGDTPDETYPEKLLKSIGDAKTTILRREYGFAVVHLPHPHVVVVNGRLSSPKRTEVEVFFVSPEFRGTGVAQRFMEEIFESYGNEGPIVVTCFDEWRRRFFERLGFVVQEEYGGPAFFMSWARTT